MNIKNATEALSALAHETRLTVFQLVLKEGSNGLRAGEIAKRMQIQPSTLSAHLNSLRRADLLHARREQQQIFYSANVNGIKALLVYLVQDCCNGDPNICSIFNVIGGEKLDHS